MRNIVNPLALTLWLLSAHIWYQIKRCSLESAHHVFEFLKNDFQIQKI